MEGVIWATSPKNPLPPAEEALSQLIDVDYPALVPFKADIIGLARTFAVLATRPPEVSVN